MTAVEWLLEELDDKCWYYLPWSIRNEISEQAKAMESQKAHEYAEFAIRCDRKGMKILNFEDWIKLETFKSE
jgi:hypothetical protein